MEILRAWARGSSEPVSRGVISTQTRFVALLTYESVSIESGYMVAQQEPQQIQVNVDPKVSKGVYSNMAEIKHSKEEFCIDFFTIFPPMGNMVSRVIISPGHVKRIISALRDNLDKYERTYGPVKEADELPPLNFGQKKA